MKVWHDGQLDLDPARPLEADLKAAPAKWAVYLMSDADDLPVQLLCVRNLRASLKRRLTESVDGPSKRVDYRDLVRRVRWKRVDNPLESDLTFLDVARIIYPERYRKIVTLRPTWWVHIDADADFPRWKTTDEPTPACGVSFGPIAEKGQAQRLVEKLEDLFDLCRYHHILVQSPAGLPCPYKDMGKCPAPCDGSVSMQQYRQLVAWSLRTLTDPATEIEAQTERMRDAAAEMRFELAGKIKTFVDAIKDLAAGDYRFVRPARSFAFVALQAGPGKGQAKLIDVSLAGCNERLGYLAEPAERPPEAIDMPVATLDIERLSLIVGHLFSPKTGGVFIARSQVTRQTLVTAYRALGKQPVATASEDEGIVRETVTNPV